MPLLYIIVPSRAADAWPYFGAGVSINYQLAEQQETYHMLTPFLKDEHGHWLQGLGLSKGADTSNTHLTWLAQQAGLPAVHIGRSRGGLADVEMDGIGVHDADKESIVHNGTPC
jgi:hypothetical protein